MTYLQDNLGILEVKRPAFFRCIFPYIIPYLLNLVPDTSTMAFRVADRSTLYALTAGPARLPGGCRPYLYHGVFRGHHTKKVTKKQK